MLAAKARGALDIADCALAAEQLLSRFKGRTHLQFLLNLIPPLTAEQIHLQITLPASAFTTLYRPKPSV